MIEIKKEIDALAAEERAIRDEFQAIKAERVHFSVLPLPLPLFTTWLIFGMGCLGYGIGTSCCEEGEGGQGEVEDPEDGGSDRYAAGYYRMLAGVSC